MERVAVEQLERQHALRAERGVDARDHDLRVGSEEAPEAFDVPRLALVVELFGEPRLELAHDLLAVEVLPHDVADDGRERLHERADVLQVLVDRGGDAGILHLHGDA